MVVVSDNETSKTIPSIAGLMVYRKDNERLYITGKKMWNEIAQERKVIYDTGVTFPGKNTGKLFDRGFSKAYIISKTDENS